MPQPNVSGAAVQKSFGLFSPFLWGPVAASSLAPVGGVDGAGKPYYRELDYLIYRYTN